ncbi:motility associated factor glycosyltransferase family protein [Pseudoalteromonas sp. SG43-7]|uniref:motility associated factor glycosyltransferase family protein n=1 Tax=Pseudoalteromonas TaxID=53246 RepID=UPI0016027AD6|nr:MULTISPECIES: 6-hydroxymethylpterin diphosphokinase MptE-like protein [unclassified Pseudoalteromonas]MBB1293551.1 motility associated factor glycosyltransferase family protein [Pseudoalteromonas sp. SR41-4]MBB1333009.1 motility associated factor glycosyltransferase family protein [Pseudoalteromonas sp. SR41-6]MBB1341128.1 motility associated factor glycosyltransferase family protein [Pseudoalteromonas sp. SR45-6]MBB1416930.1 motility associated factor glycosyltransferase family protein [Pse
MIKNIDINNELEHISEKLEKTIKHQEREAIFATEANERFEKNFECFSEFFPDIAIAIKNFKTKDDFCLHVTESGHGNFIPSGGNTLLYSQDPITQTEKQIQAQRERPVFSLTDYTGYPEDDDDTRIHSRYMVKLTRFMKKVRAESKPVVRNLPSSFPSAVIFGIGLGYHVPLLLEDTQFDYIFLVEPDFEQFFASLFCTDWFEIIKKIDSNGGCLFFHLGVDHKSFIIDLEKIAEDIGAFSLVRSFCYQHTPGTELNVLIKQWSEDYFRFQFGHGFYNDAITGLAHSIHHIRNKAALLTKTTQEIDFDTPIFIVGNGPSLDEAEVFLKNNHQKGIVIAAGTAIASLYKKGIPVDFHVLVERPYSNYKIFGDIFPADEYKKVNLLGLNTLYPDTNKRYKWAGIAGKGNEAGTCLMDVISQVHLSQILPLIPYCNPVVANAALSFLLHMGFRNIYLFGIDNGKQPSGSHHSKDSIYKVNNDDDSEGYGSLEFNGRLIEGNLGGHVVSNDLFLVAHAQLEKLLSLYKVNNCINVGNGAKLQGAIPTAADNLIDIEKEIDKELVISNIKNNYFTVLPVDDVEDRLIAVDRLQDICEHLLSIIDEDITSRSIAAKQLQRQARYVYSLRNTSLGHIFHIIKGALLYYHCPMITLLYQYEDEVFCLEKYKQLNKLWKCYIQEIMADYKIHYDEKCDLGKE